MSGLARKREFFITVGKIPGGAVQRIALLHLGKADEKCPESRSIDALFIGEKGPMCDFDGNRISYFYRGKNVVSHIIMTVTDHCIDGLW